MSKQYRTARKKYHIIYLTTCTVTGRYYIGMHSTDDLNDGYIGSGKRLWQSIQKHGRENHVMQVVEHCRTRTELRIREAEHVNEERLREDPFCMNLTLGGGGGWEQANAVKTVEQQRLASQAGAAAFHARMRQDDIFRSNMIEKYRRHQALLTMHLRDAHKGAFFNKHENAIARSKAAQPEAIAKRKATYKLINHQQGTTNSSYGKRWVHNEKESKLVSDIEFHLASGWKLGRMSKSLSRTVAPERKEHRG